MLCHLLTVAQNTKVSNLTGTIFKTKEYVEITEDIQGKIIIFFPKRYTQTQKFIQELAILIYIQHLTCNSTDIK